MTTLCTHRSKSGINCDREACLHEDGKHLCSLHALERLKDKGWVVRRGLAAKAGRG